jgi:hypothetical protein
MQQHSILAASVQELTHAYRVSLERNDPDADVFRVALMERLVMVCDCIAAGDRGVARAYGYEQERGGGAL